MWWDSVIVKLLWKLSPMQSLMYCDVTFPHNYTLRVVIVWVAMIQDVTPLKLQNVVHLN
jgi:hypothetical protein